MHADPAEAILTALRGMPGEQIVDVGVTAAEALAVMTTPPPPAGTEYDPSVVYGSAGRGGRPLTMHLYRRADRTERRPGVVFVHGGGFHEGFPEMLIRYANHLAAEGYVTASIRYRLADEAKWPAQLEDAKCAVRWMRANATELGLDPDRIAVAGNSAGGNIAAMVANTPGQFEGDGGHENISSAVAAAVLWYPLLDMRHSVIEDIIKPVVDRLFGRADVPEEVTAPASPITHVDVAPPTLTFTGTDDPLIPPRDAIAYHRRLDELGVANRLFVVDGVGHSFDFALARWEECFAEMRSFLAEQLEGQITASSGVASGGGS